jgi:hypothetical protein
VPSETLTATNVKTAVFRAVVLVVLKWRWDSDCMVSDYGVVNGELASMAADVKLISINNRKLFLKFLPRIQLSPCKEATSVKRIFCGDEG